MNESVIYLPEVDSTNLWAKHNLDKFGPIGAVYTTHQTAGRGRLGRSWLDAPHKGLYYTAVIRTDLVQPATLPLFASLAVCDALRERYRIDCQIKWPNDLLASSGGKLVVSDNYTLGRYGDLVLSADKVLAQIDNPASLPRKRVGLVALERVPVREHTELQSTDGQKIGEVTSGLLGPTVNEPVAMGYVTPAFAAIGTRVNAIVRGKVVPMEVRAMPFVPTNYYRG